MGERADAAANPEAALRAAFDVVGDEGIARLVAAFYRRVPVDPILGPMYPPEDLAGAEARLRDFLRFHGEVGGRAWAFPAFNVADSCICVGALALAFVLWRGQPKGRAAAAPRAGATG